MIREHKFSFDELVIDRSQIEKVLGFESGQVPEPFTTYLEMAYELASKLDEISAVVKTVVDFSFSEDKNTILLGGLEFNVGRLIRNELKNSMQAAVFICTAGDEISHISKDLMQGEDPVLGFVYDTMGSFIAESAGDKMHELLKAEFEKQGLKVTNRYSPGYCKWSVQDQHKLFSLFDGKTCGVKLTESSLMYPIKSISGVIGIGENVCYRKYQCELCSSKTCMYRNVK